MEMLFGNLANELFGVPADRRPQSLSEMRTPFVPEPGQTAYGYTFDWSPELGWHSRVSVGYYGTREEANASLAASLIGMNYQEPRWWQWWRWGSQKLPDDVLAILRAR